MSFCRCAFIRINEVCSVYVHQGYVNHVALSCAELSKAIRRHDAVADIVPLIQAHESVPGAAHSGSGGLDGGGFLTRLRHCFFRTGVEALCPLAARGYRPHAETGKRGAAAYPLVTVVEHVFAVRFLPRPAPEGAGGAYPGCSFHPNDSHKSPLFQTISLVEVILCITRNTEIKDFNVQNTTS